MHDTNILSSFQCLLLNISYCPATEVDLSVGKKIVSYILIEIIILQVFLFTLCSNFTVSLFSICRQYLFTTLWGGKEQQSSGFL